MGCYVRFDLNDINSMNNQSNKIINNNLTKYLNKTYSYGFSTKIKKEIIEKGLNEKTIQLISIKKKEPVFLLSFRLKSYKRWKKYDDPNWTNLRFPLVNYQTIVYYSAPKL